MSKKAPYYTPEEAAGKWICAFSTREGLQCVRYDEGDKTDQPYLYDSRDAVISDQNYDSQEDFPIRAEQFYEGRQFNKITGQLLNPGTPIVKK